MGLDKGCAQTIPIQTDPPGSWNEFSRHSEGTETVTNCPPRLESIKTLSVPKILTLFIPEILSHPAIAGRAKTLSVPPVGEPVGPREEDVRNVKASRSRDSSEGRSLQGGSGASGGGWPCALLSALQKKFGWFMWMMPPSERSGG